MNKYLCKIRQWLFNRRMDKLFRRLIDAEEKLARIELARFRYFSTEPIVETPKPRKPRQPRKPRSNGDIPIRITYD